jgi:hypothetical protein
MNRFKIPVEIETDTTGMTAKVILERIIELGVEAYKEKGIMSSYELGTIDVLPVGDRIEALHYESVKMTSSDWNLTNDHG